MWMMNFSKNWTTHYPTISAKNCLGFKLFTFDTSDNSRVAASDAVNKRQTIPHKSRDCKTFSGRFSGWFLGRFFRTVFRTVFQDGFS